MGDSENVELGKSENFAAKGGREAGTRRKGIQEACRFAARIQRSVPDLLQTESNLLCSKSVGGFRNPKLFRGKSIFHRVSAHPHWESLAT